MHVFEVAVVGAGPAGTLASLELSRHKVPHALIDARTFPRDKVCGDAFSGKAVAVMRHVIPEAAELLFRHEAVYPVHSMRFISHRGDVLQITFRTSPHSPLNGFVAPRAVFDALLWERALRSPHITPFPECRVQNYRRDGGVWTLYADGRPLLRARVLIVADGGRSVFVRKVLRRPIGGEVGAVRAYFRGVRFDDERAIELHFLRDLAPGYLWLFPMYGGRANVGLGLEPSPHRPMRRTFEALIRSARFADRFQEAVLLSPLKGWPIPIFQGRWDLVGDGFLLVGDAAALVDPFTGEGIGNAMLSGRRAAQTVASASNYSAKALAPYVRQLRADIEEELAVSTLLQRLARRPLLFAWLLRRLARSRYAHRKLSEMMVDVSARQALRSPGFYLRLLLGR